ncbi:TPA: hypothetical protein N0F65_010146 [Lagenidium giganteum]|uniref:PIG-P domain-containing protein n=1 Tax=Lagenidium giganteum TaxID=4803 RepID=A0AAV2Z301_9STRA|nr:TPA: hypothetical protein N0F65_010146 [Lagenidium giganteum]
MQAHSFQMSPETRPLGRRPSGLTLLPRGRSSSAASAISSSPPVLSFKELQRLSAMKTELFGFGGWLASTLLYVLFLVWAYVPDSTLQAYGMTYFPSKHWALAIPSMIVISYIFSIVTYFAMNLLSTPPLESYATMFDVHSVFLTDDHVDAHVEAATPPISDIPIMQVNQLQLLDD